MGSFRFCATLLLTVVCVGCASDHSAQARLDQRTALAACLSRASSAADDASGPGVVSDLCTVGIDSEEIYVLRAGLKSGSGVALSPSRDAAAFIADGALRVIGVDGDDEHAVAADGWAPEWLTPTSLGVVSADRTQIVRVDLENLSDAAAEPNVMFEVDETSELGGLTLIDSFAWHEPTNTLVVALYRQDPEGEKVVASSLVSKDRSGEVTVLAGPAATMFSQPDFHPDGDQLLVGIDFAIHRLDIATKRVTLLGLSTWLSASPSWSPDGNEAIWLADKVGGTDGPVALIHSGPDGWPAPLMGTSGGQFELLPAFPTWH